MTPVTKATMPASILKTINGTGFHSRCAKKDEHRRDPVFLVHVLIGGTQRKPLFCDRQANGEDRAARLLLAAADVNASTVQRNDAMHQCQSQPAALRAARVRAAVQLLEDL